MILVKDLTKIDGEEVSVKTSVIKELYNLASDKLLTRETSLECFLGHWFCQSFIIRAATVIFKSKTQWIEVNKRHGQITLLEGLQQLKKEIDSYYKRSKEMEYENKTDLLPEEVLENWRKESSK